MILLSCTGKVLKRVEKLKNVNHIKEEIGFYNWYVNQANINRKNYWIFTHSQSLFSLVIYVGTIKEIKIIESLFEEKLKEMLIRQISTMTEYAEELLPEKRDYTFIKTNSKSVLGSMNDFKFQLEYGVRAMLARGVDIETAIIDANQNMNSCPMGGIKYKYPKKMMKELIDNRLSTKK